MNAWRLAVGAECQGCAVQVGRSSGVADGGGGLIGKMGGGVFQKESIYQKCIQKEQSVSDFFPVWRLGSISLLAL